MKRPLFLLIDDDLRSANRTMTALNSRHAVETRWLGDAEECRMRLDPLMAGGGDTFPALVIVDLKTDAGKAAGFIRSIAPRAAHQGIQIAAVAHSLDRDVRDELLEAGAAAVFERKQDGGAFAREIASLIGFWHRSQLVGQLG